MYRSRSPASKQNWVWMKSAPASSFRRRLSGVQPTTGSTGMSVAPTRTRGAASISRPDGSVPVSRMRVAIRTMSAAPRSGTSVAPGSSPLKSGSPRSASRLGMPRAAAPRTSRWRRSLLRSRPLICSTGSSPARTNWPAAARLDRCARAPAPSVTLTASTSPLSGTARSIIEPGSAERGGVISAVTANRPVSRTARAGRRISSVSSRTLAVRWPRDRRRSRWDS